MSDEQFTVYGTLIRAGPRSRVFARKTVPTTPTATYFHGQSRLNKTHESTTDGDARLYKKSYGKESRRSRSAAHFSGRYNSRSTSAAPLSLA